MQLAHHLGTLTALTWVNMPIARSTAAVLPLLTALPSLQQLYLQVGVALLLAHSLWQSFASQSIWGGGGGEMWYTSFFGFGRVGI